MSTCTAVGSARFRVTVWSSSHFRKRRPSLRERTLVERTDADVIKAWFMAYNNKVRMEYAQAMSLAGFNPDIIVEVQQEVARNMVDWLEGQL
jgi:hypothetical protein